MNSLKDLPIRRYAVGVFVLALVAAIFGGKSIAQYLAYAAALLVVVAAILAASRLIGKKPAE